MSQYVHIGNTGAGLNVDFRQIECPNCHVCHMPHPLIGYQESDLEILILASCTNPKCGYKYILHLSEDNIYSFPQLLDLPSAASMEFDKYVSELSPSFCEICNQSYQAEQMGLKQVAGVGYRKSLEFLVKDYLISINSENAEQIKANPLMKCIGDIDNKNIKEVAKRATWLGNDETHYVRKWEEKDLNDLKALVRLTMRWVNDEIQTNQLLKDMPAGK